MDSDSQLIRIGVFYDGQYFFNVSNFYNYQHPRRSRISISGLHEFIRNRIAGLTGVSTAFCQIVDAHYFRGRFSARDSDSRNKLLSERLFEDILMNENVVSHYLPLKYDKYDKPQEKGIDVWLALEAYETAVYKRFDVVVLVACDGDYVPLVRKLHTLGAKVMLISWDFRYTDENGNTKETRTSQQLLEAVSYPVEMHRLIDSRVSSGDLIVRNLFVGNGRAVSGAVFQPQESEKDAPPEPAPQAVAPMPAIAPQYVLPPVMPVEAPPSIKELSPKEPVPSGGNGQSETEEKDVGKESGQEAEKDTAPEDDVKTSTIFQLKNGYGFIRDDTVNNVFFYHTTLEDIDFNDLRPGMRVQYLRELKDGRYTATRVWVAQ